MTEKNGSNVMSVLKRSTLSQEQKYKEIKMRKEIYYVVKTDEGYKAPKGQFVKSLNRAVFYGTLKKAQETAEDPECINPKIIEIEIAEVKEV